MRKKPYTTIGISRIPCKRCGKPSRYQWQVCALNNVYMGVCQECDIELNELTLNFFKIKGRKKILDRYNDSKPTEETKAHDLGVYGMTVEKDGKRIDPKDMYKPVIKEGWEKRFDVEFLNEHSPYEGTRINIEAKKIKSFIRNETRGEGDG